MSESRAAKGFILGILAGAVTGGILALLFAPKSGRELRKDIGHKKDELFDDAERYLEMSKKKATDIISDGREKAEEMIDDAKKKINNLKYQAEDFIASGKDKLSRESHKVKDAVKAGVDAYNDKSDRQE